LSHSFSTLETVVFLRESISHTSQKKTLKKTLTKEKNHSMAKGVFLTSDAGTNGQSQVTEMI
jgi:hypothetical protein